MDRVRAYEGRLGRVAQVGQDQRRNLALAQRLDRGRDSFCRPVIAPALLGEVLEQREGVARDLRGERAGDAVGDHLDGSIQMASAAWDGDVELTQLSREVLFEQLQ